MSNPEMERSASPVWNGFCEANKVLPAVPVAKISDTLSSVLLQVKPVRMVSLLEHIVGTELHLKSVVIREAAVVTGTDYTQPAVQPAYIRSCVQVPLCVVVAQLGVPAGSNPACNCPGLAAVPTYGLPSTVWNRLVPWFPTYRTSRAEFLVISRSIQNSSYAPCQVRNPERPWSHSEFWDQTYCAQ